MNYLGIELNVKNIPELDRAFIPMGPWMIEYEKEASRPVGIAIEREEGKVTVFETKLRGEEYEEANLRYLEIYIKFCLWLVGYRMRMRQRGSEGKRRLRPGQCQRLRC